MANWRLLAQDETDNNTTVSLDSGIFAAYNHLKVIITGGGSDSGSSDASDTHLLFNTDSLGDSNSYNSIEIYDGSSSSSVNSDDSFFNPILRGGSSGIDTDHYTVMDIMNEDDEHKMIQGTQVRWGSTAPIPWRFDACWHKNEQITRIRLFGSTGGTNVTGRLANGTRMIVFGMDVATPIAKDKSTITDIPEGTRYEETDTRKIFRMATDLVSGTGLRAYYNCDSATVDNNAALVAGNDTLGSSANATNSNVTLDTSNEKLGSGCLDFNGTNGKLSIPAQANLVEGLTEWSVSFWVWVDDWSDATEDKMMMSQWNTSGSDGSVFRIEPQNNQTIKLRIRKDDNQATMYNGETTCGGNGTWNHVVFNFYEDSGQKGQLYINGSVDSGGVVSFPNDMRANADDTALEIGNQTTQGDSEFSGKFDEISFWSRKLTTAEITMLYNSGAGMNLATGTQLWKEKGTA